MIPAWHASRERRSRPSTESTAERASALNTGQQPADAAALRRVIEGRRIMVLTGAGCSTASGIGDYRDADGQWKRSQPIQHQDFVRSARARQRYWARSMVGWPEFAAAEPNPAHRALAEIEARGVVTALVTQNVDGLHQRAGSREVIDLHGNLAAVVCLGCGDRTDRRALQARLLRDNPDFSAGRYERLPDGDAALAEERVHDVRVPACAECGGVLKPDVVFYGDSVPRARVDRAFAALEAADALLVVGSSLMVFSGFRFARRARELGLPIAAINLGRVRGGEWFDCILNQACEDALPQLIATF